MSLRAEIRGPRGILCTRGEKEQTSKRVSVIVYDNVISKTRFATRTRPRKNPSRTPKIHQILAVLRGVCIFIKNEILTQTGGNPYLFDRTFNIMRKNAVFRARIYYLYNKIG